MSAALRVRLVALLAVLGTSATAAGYLSGAPAWVGILMSATTLVAAVALTFGRVAALIVTALAAVTVVIALTAGDGQVRTSFGNAGAQPASLVAPVVVGLAALASSLLVAIWIGRSLSAVDSAGGPPSGPLGATLVRLSLGPGLGRKRRRRVTGADLAEMVAPELRELRGVAVVRDGRSVDVLVLLPGADDERADALVRRLERMVGQQLERTLRSSTIILEGPAGALVRHRPERRASELSGVSAISGRSADLM